MRGSHLLAAGIAIAPILQAHRTTEAIRGPATSTTRAWHSSQMYNSNGESIRQKGASWTKLPPTRRDSCCRTAHCGRPAPQARRAYPFPGSQGRHWGEAGQCGRGLGFHAKATKGSCRCLYTRHTYGVVRWPKLPPPVKQATLRLGGVGGCCRREQVVEWVPAPKLTSPAQKAAAVCCWVACCSGSVRALSARTYGAGRGARRPRGRGCVRAHVPSAATASC